MSRVHGVVRGPASFMLVVFAVLGSACSTAPWSRWLYDIGDNYACQQAGVHQRAAAARASQCADAQHPDRNRYEDYQAARTATLKQQP